MAPTFKSPLQFEKKKMLIWGKTYPELSDHHIETVCTGAVFEDGRPIRIYPIPFRYLDGADKYVKYQWITAGVVKSTTDTRPETYKIDPYSIKPGIVIKPNPKNQWAARADILFKDRSWQFDSMDALQAARESRGVSLAVITPLDILGVSEVERPVEQAIKFHEKLNRLKSTTEQTQSLFEETLPREIRDLDYISSRMQVDWICSDPGCGTSRGHKMHRMQVLDWEVVAYHRKRGGPETTTYLAEKLDMEENDIRFFLGTLVGHQNRFTIVGFWYPKKIEGLLSF